MFDQNSKFVIKIVNTSQFSILKTRFINFIFPKFYELFEL